VGKTLVITEKPSVARDIAGVLGGLEDRDGWFENDRWVVTFAVGHLLELLEPEEIDPAYKRWTLANLPILPEQFQVKPKKGQTDRVRTIQRLLARDDVDDVVNACDAGREGELIFRELAQYLGNRKPVRRLWLQSMTADAIRRGFENLQPAAGFEGLGRAAECRAWSDWLIGMNATRALTKRLKTRSETTAWSAGRVQTPTLAILVGRELEILSHVARPYWSVTASFLHDGNSYTGTWFDPAFEAGADEEARDDRLFDEARARAIVEATTGRPGQAEETRKPSREAAPPLFDLTSLQRECNRRFGWSARRALSAAQRCYEGHKILTYPRTDSRCLPRDYRGEVDRLIGVFAGAGGRSGAVSFADYAQAGARLQKRGLENVARTFDDAGVSDHFAIIPTGVLPHEGLSGDDRRVYDLVVRRFLGNFHPPAVWERVERTTEVAGERFRTRARALQEPGWRSVLPQSGEDEEAVALPPLRAGADEASGVPVRTQAAELHAEETKPPPRISEARLLSLMENAGKQIEDEDFAAVLHEKGIGTPATRAEIIENLIAKGYVVRIGKALRPSVKGIRLIDILRRIHADRLASPELTGEIEYHLLQVERGQREASDFMNEIRGYTAEIVEAAKTFEYDALFAAEAPLGPCLVCGKPVRERAWFYACDSAADNKAENRCPLVLWKDVSGRYLDRKHAAALLRDGKTDVIDGFTARDGRVYRGMLEIDRETWKVVTRSMGASDEAASATPEYEVNPEPLGRCPFDEDCAVVESPTHFLCERKLKEQELGKDEARPKSCGFALPRTVCKREVTRDEARFYVQNRRTELLTDFTSRFGRPFSATLVLRDNGRHGFEFPPRAPRAGATTGEGEATSGRRAGGARTGGRRKAKPKVEAGEAAAAPATKPARTVRRRPAARRGRRTPSDG
jgi:DNA topoisomerase-3